MLLGLRGVGKTVLLQRILGDVSPENTVQDLEASPALLLPEQITPIMVLHSHQHYVQSMAKVVSQPVKSAEVVANLGISPSKAAPIRALIVKKGMAYYPRRGEVPTEPGY